VLKWLLGREADIRAIDAEGRTVLQFAAKRGHSDVVITLLNGGADTEAIDAKGRTALHYAAGNGSENVVEMLLSVVNGNIVSTQDANGKTALDFLASWREKVRGSHKTSNRREIGQHQIIPVRKTADTIKRVPGL
jgi:ankyrin repeat protein